MNKKVKIALEISLFVLIFGGIMVLASFFDMNISHILTKGALEPGEFYTKNFMGALIEVIGSFPIFVALFFATLAFANLFFKKQGKIKHLGWLFVILSVVDITWFTRDTVKYIVRLIGQEYIYELPWMMAIYIAVGIGISILGHYLFFKKVSEENNKKWIKFSWVILFTCAFYILVTVIKGPVGRMRYRAMNELGLAEEGFTPWYVISSAKDVYGDLVSTSDAFKSFPSGHTFSAGCCYVLLAVPYIFDKFNSKKYKILSYVVTVSYTALVALYRIRVGAHFLSDVAMGGTIAYVAAQVANYVFVIRPSNKLKRE